MKISIGADHRGFRLKQIIMQSFPTIIWSDVGAYDDYRSDYPIFANRVCQHIKQGVADRGILICGSGIGMAIAANRHKGIYAALCWNVKIATISREDDGSNLLVLPADFITEQEAISIVCAWSSTFFKEGHYQERLAMLDGSGYDF